MQARIRPDCLWKVVQAFGGMEYVKYEWRYVPVANEEEAQRHPFLEVEGGLTEPAVILPPNHLIALSLEELRAMGKAAKLPFAATMKRETLLARLAALEE